MRLTLDIPDEIHARLKARAKEEGTTMRALILDVLDDILRSRKRQWRSPQNGY
jgi:plasmid stability protein